MMPTHKVMKMTKDEVIEALRTGQILRTEDGAMGKIQIADTSDNTASLEGVEERGMFGPSRRWIKWEELSAASAEDVAAVERAQAEKAECEQMRPARYEKFMQALGPMLTSAPRVTICAEKMAMVKEERRDLEHRLIAVFHGESPLIISFDESGEPVGTMSPGGPITIDDIELIED
jgi:hypothetical protein